MDDSRQRGLEDRPSKCRQSGLAFAKVFILSAAPLASRNPIPLHHALGRKRNLGDWLIIGVGSQKAILLYQLIARQNNILIFSIFSCN
jgi:hypothetical protein